MKQIEFNSIEIRGFGSIYAPLHFNLNHKGINIIRAANGAGKSTIISALVWAIWGKPLKFKSTIPTYKEYRDKGFLGTKVELKIAVDGVEYVIIRCKDYKGSIPVINGKGASGIYLYNVTDKFLVNSRDKGDVQEVIDNLVGYSMELFKNSVVFGQKVTRLIGESGPKQKEILEKAFSVAYINAAKDRQDKYYKELCKEYAELNTKYLLASKDRELAESELHNIKALKKQYEDNRQNNIVELAGRIKEANHRLKKGTKDIDDKLAKIMGELEEIQAKGKILREKIGKKDYSDLVFNTDNLVMRLKMDKSQLLKQAEGLRNLIADGDKRCPTCGSVLNKEKAKELKANRVAEYKKLSIAASALDPHIQEAEAKAAALRDKEAVQQTRIKKLESLTTKVKLLGAKVKLLEENKENLQRTNQNIKIWEQSLENLKNNKNPHDTTQANKRLKDVEAIELDLLAKRDKLKKKVDVQQWLVSEALSNKGLKAYIFNAMLGQVNDRLKYYSTLIGFRAEINIDMESANKNVVISIWSGKQLANAFDLSGGQCQLIDIAIAFSIHDVISSNYECNLLFMDEVFESLDSENVELVTNLIIKKSKGKALFLITHLKDFNIKSSNIIQLTLDSNKHTQLLQ